MGEDRPRPLTPYKARTRYQFLPLIIVEPNHGSYWREDADTEGTDFGDLLSTPKSLIVVDGSSHWAHSTSHLVDRHVAFDYGLRLFETRVFGPSPYDDLDTETEWTFAQELCFEWGLRPKLFPGRKTNAHWHMVLDPAMFLGPHGFSDDLDLYTFASGYRNWCKGRNIPLSLTKGSAAGRVLRSLVTDAQCKVPFATNQNCRKALGANLMRADTHGRMHANVTEFDQRSAQHLVARDIPMPDRNTFTAQGDFITQELVCFLPGDSVYSALTQQGERGVLLATVEQWPEYDYRKQFPWSPYRPWTDEPLWVTTNELSLVHRCGIHITGIIAAWTSPDRNTELRTHALTALEELALATVPQKDWMKPLNLSVYGATASTPRPMVRESLREGRKEYRLSGERMTNHVAWLAMIQTEVRKRSVMFAMDLESIDVTVVGIYVDAVFAKIGNHDLDGYVPAYFVEKAKGTFGGKNGVKVFDDKVTLPGTPLSDPRRADKAHAYLSS